MKEVQAMADELNVSVSKSRTTAHSIFRANAGADGDGSATNYHRINVMLPAVDAVLQDMQRRFGSDKPPRDTTSTPGVARLPRSAGLRTLPPAEESDQCHLEGRAPHVASVRAGTPRL